MVDPFGDRGNLHLYTPEEMRSERIGCEAEVHQPGCECLKCNSKACYKCPNHTLDHFTGKAIGRKLGWTNSHINSQENFQFLSPTCHRAKDSNTTAVLQQLDQQQHGRFIHLGEHVQIGLKDYET